MRSMVRVQGVVKLPLIEGKHSMIPFNVLTLEGIPEEFRGVADSMLKGVKREAGTAFFTIHGRKLTAGGTLRRGGPHTDGNYEPHLMSFGGGGGNGWKVGQDGPAINTALHGRQYNNERGGIIMASNYEACLGWVGVYDGLPNAGGDCSHLDLGRPFVLSRNVVYYGNNHFIHESLPVAHDVHRVLARITMPEDHSYER